jgi:predicted RNA binding protein YcfA (HicA-like mRNA interferase family)
MSMALGAILASSRSRPSVRIAVHKEIKEIVKRLEANGYQVVHGGKHLKVKSPDGATIYTLPTTPSGSLWMVRLLRDLERRGLNLMEYTIEIETVPGFGASDFVDLLAELVYADNRFVAPTIAVNGNGSITVAFEVSASDAEEASTTAFSAFGAAIATAATRYAGEQRLDDVQAAIIAAARSAAGAVGSLRVDRGRQPVSA